MDDERVLVEGVNVVKKHTKAQPDARHAGRHHREGDADPRLERRLFNPITGKGDRVGFKTLEDGGKVRYFKSNGEVVDV